MLSSFEKINSDEVFTLQRTPIQFMQTKTPEGTPSIWAFKDPHELDQELKLFYSGTMTGLEKISVGVNIARRTEGWNDPLYTSWTRDHDGTAYYLGKIVRKP